MLASPLVANAGDKSAGGPTCVAELLCALQARLSSQEVFKINVYVMSAIKKLRA